MIGDKDPEDAYDRGDPPTVRVAVLERVVADLRARRDADTRHDARRLDALRVVAVLALARGVDRARVAAIRRALEEL